MKSLILMTTFFMPALLMASIIEAQPEVFATPPKGVYVPQGFDSNDNVEIFFEGEFEDACHQVGMTSHTVDLEDRSIYVTDLGYYFGQDFCNQMTVPYQKGVNTGMLPTGEWKVYFRHSRGNFVEQGAVAVKPPTSSKPDEHLYAPVNKIEFIKRGVEEPPRVKLSGKFYNTCMKMDYVKVGRQGNVIEILPIAMMERGGCEERPEGIDFDHMVRLNNVDKGRFLLHTRANNGRSVNEIVTIQ